MDLQLELGVSDLTASAFTYWIICLAPEVDTCSIRDTLVVDFQYGSILSPVNSFLEALIKQILEILTDSEANKSSTCMAVNKFSCEYSPQK